MCVCALAIQPSPHHQGPPRQMCVRRLPGGIQHSAQEGFIIIQHSAFSAGGRALRNEPEEKCIISAFGRLAFFFFNHVLASTASTMSSMSSMYCPSGWRLVRMLGHGLGHQRLAAVRACGRGRRRSRACAAVYAMERWCLQPAPQPAPPAQLLQFHKFVQGGLSRV